MQKPLLFASAVFAGLVSLVGCGKPPTPTTPQEVKQAAVDSEPESSPALGETAATDTPASSSVPSASSEQGGTTSAPAVDTPTSSPAEASQPAAEPIKPYEPTAAQLALWKQPEYSALQLLSYRDQDNSPLYTCSLMLPDGKQYVTGGTQLTLWSLDSPKPLKQLAQSPQDVYITSLAVAPNGKWFTLGDSAGNVQVWSVADLKVLHEKKLYETGVVQVAVAPDGKQLATIGFDDHVSVWTTKDLAALNRFKVDTNGLKKIAYLSDKQLAAAGETTSIYDITSGKAERQLSPGRYNFVLQATSDRSRLIYGRGETIQVQTVADGNEITVDSSFANDERVTLTPDQRMLATANGNSVRVWWLDAETKTGRLVQVFDAVGYAIVDLNWSSDGALLTVVSQDGRTRVYGTSHSGEKYNLKPLMPPVPQYTQGSDTPATPAQLQACIDLRTFPRPPKSTVQLSDAKQLMLSTPGSVDDATQFYQYFLHKAGWVEVPTATPLPGNHEFQKENFSLNLMVQDAGGQCSVSINHVGRLDLRRLPKMDGDIQTVYENENTVMYRTKARIPQIEAALLRKLHAAGWCPFSRLNSAHNDPEDRRDLSLIRGSAELLVSISQAPDDRESCMVQYSRLTTFNSLPIPADVSYAEFDGATQPRIVALSKLGLDELATFYETKLTGEGWVALGKKKDKEGKSIWLSFIQDQKDLLLGLYKHGDGRTLVAAGDGVVKSSWQLSEATEDEATPEAKDAVGIEAADFPILNDSKQAKFDAVDQSIEVAMDKLTLVQAGETYEKALNALGWENDGDGIRDSDYVMLRFKKAGLELTVRGRMAAGTSTINVQGDGLLWNKELAGGAKITSYEAWLKAHHHPASLDLLDEFLAEMTQIQNGK